MEGLKRNKKYTQEEYDEYFKEIREVLYDNRHITRYQLMNGTGIPMEVIKHLINEGLIQEKIDQTLGVVEQNKELSKAAKFREQVIASGMLNRSPKKEDSQLLNDLHKKYKNYDDGR